MLSEEKPDIRNNAITEELDTQEQVSQSQYGYGIPESSDRVNSGYPGGWSGGGDGRREGQSKGMNGAGLEFVDEELSTIPTMISEGPGPSIKGDGHRVVPPGGAQTATMRSITDVTPLLEESAKGKERGGGIGIGLALERDAEVVEFRVKKKAWGEAVGSPIARLPNEVLMHTFSFLDPATLSALSLVSRWFHTLISSPHTWRSAFARYFPAQAHLPPQQQQQSTSQAAGSTLCPHDEEIRASYSCERRYFTRLTSVSTWRKEYLLRTALLRSLSRGKAHVPQYAHAKHPNSGNAANAGSIITYLGRTGGTSVTHISATFPAIDRSPKKEGNWNGQGQGQGTAALRPHLMHGSCENGMVASSDPTTGRIDRVVTNGASMLGTFMTFPVPGLAAHRPGIELGSSIMDLSEEMGWCMGETVPVGRVYIELNSLANTATRGYYLYLPGQSSEEHYAYISSLWITKKKNKGVFETTGGSCGLLVGDSVGKLRMYRLPNNSKERDNPDSWLYPVNTWIVSPGVPILGIQVDEEYSVKRERSYKQRRDGMVVVIVNALGEVWYLRDFGGPWRVIEQTRRRVAFMDEEDMKVVVSVKECIGLGWERVQRLWRGWGMDYFLEVDFAVGNVLLGKRGRRYVDPVTGEMDKDVYGVEEVKGGWVKCFQIDRRTKDAERITKGAVDLVIPPKARSAKSSIFGGRESPEPITSDVSQDLTPLSDVISEDPFDNSTTNDLSDEDIWTLKDLSFSYDQTSHITLEISAFAMDKSILATLSSREDSHADGKTHELPGLNARLFAVGTSTGSVYVWNLRSPRHTSSTDYPLRIIHTDSPTITTLGLTSLYLIHGGSDGLVQCWDPLASTLNPIRTIHSRFSSRARRRMTQAEQSNQNHSLGDNQYAARAVQVDSDPTVLRGVVALGTYVRYWSFAGDVSSTINGKRKKKAVRRAGVGGGGTGVMSRREVVENLRGEIVGELGELEREREREEKEERRFREKFGVEAGRGGLTEEEMLVYARMLSEEAFEKERGKEKDVYGVIEGGSSTRAARFVGELVARNDEDEEAALAAALAASVAEAENSERGYPHNHTPTSPSITSPSPSSRSTYETDSMHEYKHGYGGHLEKGVDAELAEAIRLSLLDATPGAGVSFRYNYDRSTPGGSGASTAIPCYVPRPGANGKAYVNPVTTADESSGGGSGSGLPASSSWGLGGGNVKEKNRVKGKKKWVGVDIDEWPSPKHAAMMVDEGSVKLAVSGKAVGGARQDSGGPVEVDENLDEELELAIRLSLAEEESQMGGGAGE
ncbi:hypothetical protein EV426DRAFT_720912 [Tirmania nivea]|nr:hypothetical protein EV426DRAFT_720912 [Tirmania nivea]